MTDVLLRVENLHVSVGDTPIIQGISLEIKRGEIHAIMGRNGAGKSTLVKILSGVIMPDEGQIFLNNKALKLNSHLGNIGEAIQKYVEKKGYSVVRDFCGHGTGETFHKEPNVLHYGKNGEGQKLEVGMIFTIEPMINEGKYETKVLSDGWTAVTKDKKLSAQFEHTVGITNDGYEIFTISKKGLNFPPYK